MGSLDALSTVIKYKWTDLKHNGPAFAPPYECLPENVYFKYDGQKVSLSEPAEEMAVAYAKVLHRKFASDKVFKLNFFNDWKKVMTLEQQAEIKDIKKCDFTMISTHFSQNDVPRDKTLNEKYGFCTIDGVRTEISNYNMEPPGLFNSKTSKKGKWKKRIQPEDVTINCSEGYKPPEEHQWKAIVHNRSVSWLAKWPNPISRGPKYMRLSSSAKLKGEEDRKKYDKAVALGTCIEQIRKKYREDWESEDTRQLAIAVYLIDTFAFRAGGDHDDTEDADTVGCCSLRVEHITLDDEQEVVEFDFHGKASIRYNNKQKIEHGAFEGLKSLTTGKAPNKLIFDQLTTDKVNKYLKNCMDNLTIKVFRTFKASSMLEAELQLKTEPTMTKEEQMLVFRKANQEVAKLCNHRRTQKLLLNMPTSKEHYIDPRIVVAWCLKFNVPIDTIYTKKLRKKFRWAIEQSLESFIFYRKGNGTDGNSEASSSE
ncbi:DNA topoisomerase 1-like isoform X2 [Ochlerotatus camptorhynchus]|uniref:DNA topoisomerase 1-like isoform X2 n=1 Tax=Ochlerotatus camptorhynchus TaxID=644619 RepID=UPI0031D61D2E